MTPGPLGVVIPTLDEEDALPGLLDDLSRLPFPVRIVVVDGGSRDRTVHVAEARGAEVLRTERGRARQMNAGAGTLGSPWLLFLHADCRLPERTRERLARWLARPPAAEAGHFAFSLDARGPWGRVIEAGQRVRERLSGLPHGDQGLLVSARRWREVGGFPEIPLMEDVEIARRLHATGGLDRIDAPLPTSARRYRDEGILRATVRNGLLLVLHAAGVSPSRLARWYPARRAPEPSSPARRTGTTASPEPDRARRTLVVFAKAPRPGRVKTRLAIDVGAGEAASIYRAIGRRVVDRLRGGPFRVVVHHAPRGAEAEMRRWLGGEGLEFRPQEEGDLGARMRRAFDHAFEGADRVCIVGTDSPELDASRIERAFRLLDRGEGADAVFGPARDGGYYLLALRERAPGLFEDVPWSTPEVLSRSLERARALELRVRFLSPLDDVDRLEDVPPEFLPGSRRTVRGSGLLRFGP